MLFCCAKLDFINSTEFDLTNGIFQYILIALQLSKDYVWQKFVGKQGQCWHRFRRR